MLCYGDARTRSASSMYDVTFSLAYYFPEWAFPSSLWKEDRMTRRRKISKFFSTSRCGDRLYTSHVRNKTLEWASNSSKRFKDDYTDEMINGVDEFFNSLHQFKNLVFDPASSSKPKPIILEMFKANKIIDSFAKKNNATFSKMMKKTNDEFDTLVNPAGELRVNFESIRYDIMQELKETRSKLYRMVHDDLMHSFSDTLNCLHDFMGQTIVIKSVQQLHTCFKSILKKESFIQGDILKYKKRFASIWKQVINELFQRPWHTDYWIDVFAEVQEGATKLGKHIYKSVKTNYRSSGFRFNNNRGSIIQCHIDLNY